MKIFLHSYFILDFFSSFQVLIHSFRHFNDPNGEIREREHVTFSWAQFLCDRFTLKLVVVVSRAPNPEGSYTKLDGDILF